MKHSNIFTGERQPAIQSFPALLGGLSHPEAARRPKPLRHSLDGHVSIHQSGHDDRETIQLSDRARRFQAWASGTHCTSRIDFPSKPVRYASRVSRRMGLPTLRAIHVHNSMIPGTCYLFVPFLLISCARDPFPPCPPPSPASPPTATNQIILPTSPSKPPNTPSPHVREIKRDIVERRAAPRSSLWVL